MQAKLVPDQLTSCTVDECARAFSSALETVTGATPTKRHLCILLAQSALESGRWRSMHCWNFGNVKASPTYSGLYCQFRCNEVIGGKVLWFDPPHPQCNFRAFESIETGAVDHMRFLSLRKSYAQAWGQARLGDPVAFVHALKLSGYFTADEGPYSRAVTLLFMEYMRLLTEPERDTLPAPAQDEAQLHAAAIMAVAPDPWRMLHTEATLAAANSMDGVWDAIREERNAALREE